MISKSKYHMKTKKTITLKCHFRISEFRSKQKNMIIDFQSKVLTINAF